MRQASDFPNAEPDPKPTREQRLEACLNFFASVIKSGEPWTSACQNVYEAARTRDPEPDFNNPAFNPAEPGPDDHLLELPEPGPRDREVAALRHEISWLRDVHKHTIDQLAARYALVPPAPVFIPNPQPRTTVSVTLDAARVEQLLAIEKAAQAIVDPETRLRARQGHGSDVTYVANSQFLVLSAAVLNAPKDQP